MDKNKLMEQLRKAVREVIQEELGKSSYDAKSGISSTELKNKEGKVVGYIKHTTKDGKLVAGGRIGPKAAKAATTEEKTTVNIPVAALPSYKKGQQPTVINPQTGEEEVVSDVSSWAKKADENKYSLPAGSMKPKEPVKPKSALEKRFGHLKPGESASLKGDPQDVKKKEREELDELNPQTYRDTAFIRRNQAHHQIGWSGSDKPDYRTSLKMNNRADDLDRHATDIENKRRAKVLSKDGRVVHGSASGATRRKFGIRGENVESYTLEEFISMLEEAGYSLEEGAMDTLRKVGSKVAAGMKRVKHAGNDIFMGYKIGTTAADRKKRGDIHGRPHPLVDEEYTLDEWIGKLEEAGYKVNKK